MVGAWLKSLPRHVSILSKAYNVRTGYDDCRVALSLLNSWITAWKSRKWKEEHMAISSVPRGLAGLRRSLSSGRRWRGSLCPVSCSRAARYRTGLWVLSWIQRGLLAERAHCPRSPLRR